MKAKPLTYSELFIYRGHFPILDGSFIKSKRNMITTICSTQASLRWAQLGEPRSP